MGNSAALVERKSSNIYHHDSNLSLTLVTRWVLRKCTTCGEYTLKSRCPKCAGRTSIPHPPKFSLDDKYAKYRRAVREESLKRSKASES
ncbi:MAG: RNA-protein complex protein Nop10 [Candidatus Bathyarchaeia archaeon]